LRFPIWFFSFLVHAYIIWSLELPICIFDFVVIRINQPTWKVNFAIQKNPRFFGCYFFFLFLFEFMGTQFDHWTYEDLNVWIHFHKDRTNLKVNFVIQWPRRRSKVFYLVVFWEFMDMQFDKWTTQDLTTWLWKL
jgi:hypothetical protein